MNNQYNFDRFAYDNSVYPTTNDRNVPLANINFSTNMSPNGMNTSMMMPMDMMNGNMQSMNMTSPMSPNVNPRVQLTTPEEGYMRGNLFDNLYDQYKNYRPMKLVPNNEQADILLQINMYTFALHELRLYLDIYPDNPEFIGLFNQYQNMANQMIQKYEQNYGPLNWFSTSSPNNFDWESTAWPWEMGVM